MPTVSERTGPGAKRIVRLVCGLCLAMLAGCGQTQIAPEHRELIQRLATATSMRDSANLAVVEEEVASLSAGSEMSPEQTATFSKIVALAKGGDWDAARDRAYALRDGQKPTASDLEAVASRKLPEMIRIEKGTKTRKNAG